MTKRIPSRRMPPRGKSGPLGAAGAIVVAGGLLAGAAWALVTVPWAISVAVMAALGVGMAGSSQQVTRMAAEREQESICTFARSVDAREIDPWIIRAVYEELSACCAVPVRARDHFDHDLALDQEDLGDAVMDIAERAGRSLEYAGDSPFGTSFATVRDLLNVLNHQPRKLSS